MRTRSATHIQQQDGNVKTTRARTPVGKRELQSPVQTGPGRGRDGAFPSKEQLAMQSHLVSATNGTSVVQTAQGYPMLQVGTGLQQGVGVVQNVVQASPVLKDVEVNVWAWRYGKDREWKSIRECVMKIGEQRIVVMKGDDVLQEIAFSNLEHAYNYATSSRVIISARSGYAMFLSLDKKYHIWFKKCMQANNLPSTEVSYGVFFRQQKSLSFPPAPCYELNDGGSQQSSQESNPDEVLQLQAQLDALKQRNSQLNHQLNHMQHIHRHPHQPRQQLPEAFCLPQRHIPVPISAAYSAAVPTYPAAVTNTPYPPVGYPVAASHGHLHYEYVHSA